MCILNKFSNFLLLIKYKNITKNFYFHKAISILFYLKSKRFPLEKVYLYNFKKNTAKNNQ